MATKKKVKSIHIHLHGADGDHEGFEVEHEFEQAGTGSYEPPESQGVMEDHGAVIDHIHKVVKEHGMEGGDCPCCAPGGGESEVKGSHPKNITKHGYEKGSPNDFRGGGGMKHSAKHPGFKAVQNKIASKEGLSEKAAGAILASRSRGASAGAHKANPRLNRVRG
jgi:hypothetical protein